MKIVLFILLGLFLLLCVPLRLSFSLENGETKASLRWLFLKKTLLPSPEGEEGQDRLAALLEKLKARLGEDKPDEDKTEASDKGAAKKKPPKLTAQEWIGLARDLLPRCQKPVRTLLRRTTVAKPRFLMVVVGKDAADTAIRFGRLNTAVFSAAALLDSLFTLRNPEIRLIPGFTAEKESVLFSAAVRLFPLAALLAACNLGVLFLGAALRARRQPPRQERKASHGKQKSPDQRNSQRVA